MRRHVDLFSGIGGFALAASWAGYQTVQFVEIDRFCQQVLHKHWPEVNIHDDIRTFDGTSLAGTIDLLTGGFPCQPYSVAGKRAGESDDRALWPEMRRVIAEVRPRWVVGENVAGFVSMGLDDLLADLASLGYETGALVVPAAAVGAPHRRDRIWIVAHAEREPVRADRRGGDAVAAGADQGAGSQRQWLWSDDSDGGAGSGARLDADAPDGGIRRGSAPGLAGQPAQLRQAVPDAGCGDGDGRAADAGWHITNRQDAGWPEGPGGAEQRGGGQVECRLGGGAHGLSAGIHIRQRWLAGTWEDGIPRVTAGCPDRAARLRALGNSICPHVAYEIIRHIEEIV